MQTLLDLVESHISSHTIHHRSTWTDGILLSFAPRKIFLLSLPCRPIILLAPAPIIRHVDGMWPVISLCTIAPLNMVNYMERTGRVLLECSLAGLLQTKRLVSGHWHNGILLPPFAYVTTSLQPFGGFISSGGSSPPSIRHAMFDPTLLNCSVPNCNDQRQ